MKRLSFLFKGSGADTDKMAEPEVLLQSTLRLGVNPRTESPWGFFTTFQLLPSTTQAAANDKFLITLGTGTEVIARSTKGGINVKTQVTSPADNDNALLIGVATTSGQIPFSAKSLIRFACRVNLTQITQIVFGAGVDENITSPIGSATAGEGCQFLFDPLNEMATGIASYATNFILATKINGVDEYLDSGVKVLAGRDYELAIQIGADLKAKYYVNDVLVGTSVTALTDGDSVMPVIGVQASGTPDTQKDFDVRYVSIERQIG